MEPLREITVGTPVLVRNQFDGAWAPDFQIAIVHSGGCQVRRNRDGALLPKIFAWADLKAAQPTQLRETAA